MLRVGDMRVIVRVLRRGGRPLEGSHGGDSPAGQKQGSHSALLPDHPREPELPEGPDGSVVGFIAECLFTGGQVFEIRTWRTRDVIPHHRHFKQLSFFPPIF